MKRKRVVIKRHQFRKEVIGDATLYLGDCLDILPMLGKVDAVVTDPPYGIGIAKYGKIGSSKVAVVSQYPPSSWDNQPCSNEQLSIMRSISDWQIIFGGNFFDLPPTSCWLIWDKENSGDFADAEMAWTNLKKAIRLKRYMWNGMIKAKPEPRFHPTQKPFEVIKWCILHLPDNTNIILDPFMGSGTTGVACMNLGRKFIGIEIDPKYFDISCKRIEAAWKEPKLFAPEKKNLSGKELIKRIEMF